MDKHNCPLCDDSTASAFALIDLLLLAIALLAVTLPSQVRQGFT
jgi:hypothetical protein